MPLCILRYINDTLHQCQVYLTKLIFHSLVQPTNAPIRIDPLELELATSPCIYRVVMHCDHMDSPGFFTDEWIMSERKVVKRPIKVNQTSLLFNRPIVRLVSLERMGLNSV